MNKTKEHIKIGELEVPASYWNMIEEDKTQLCLTLMDSMLIVLDHNLKPGINRIEMLDLLLESSIIVNEKEENYEICEVMKKIRQLINEQGN